MNLPFSVLLGGVAPCGGRNYLDAAEVHESALNLVLDQYDLTTMIKDEVLMVTSKERAEEHLANRVYRLDPAWQLTADELIEVITATVEPNSWHEVGGPGRLVPIRGGFVISAADAVHAKINQLLGQIDRVR